MGSTLIQKEFAPRSKFFPLRVDPISSAIFKRSKWEFMQIIKSLFSKKKRQGVFIGAGVFIRSN